MSGERVESFRELHREYVILEKVAPEEAAYRMEDMDWLWHQLSEEEREELRPLYVEQCK
jgi:hypothetical protein